MRVNPIAARSRRLAALQFPLGYLAGARIAVDFTVVEQCSTAAKLRAAGKT
jgi:hypothetical protein